MPLLVVVSLLAALLAGFDARAYDDVLDPVVTEQAHVCAPLDHQEPGLQGDVPPGDVSELGFNCGLALVGHTSLSTDGRPPGGNANMAWAGDCAYVAGGGSLFNSPVDGSALLSFGEDSGVAVVDVSEPTQPRHVDTIGTEGANRTAETLHAVDNGDVALLVVGQYGNDQASAPKPMDIYDVSDCAAPVLLGTYLWPENIHNLTISPDGRYVFATQPLQVIELLPNLHDTGLEITERVRFLGNLDDAMEGPFLSVGPMADIDDELPPQARDTLPFSYSSHEAWPVQADGRTVLHLGGQLPVFEVFTVVDVTDWLADPTKAPEVLSQRQGRGHSVRTATIGGEPYVLHSEESVFFANYGCVSEEANPFAGPSQPWLTKLGDGGRTQELVSQFGLEINEPENCQTQASNDVNASVHYHDVDDAGDTTFVMASMWNAGLRLFDVRDPKQPKEVGYFNPADVDPGDDVVKDKAWGHVRYVEETGHIWFATETGGFWVLEIEKDLQKALDIRRTPVLHKGGRPGTQGVVVDLGSGAERAAAGQTSTAYYCTIPGGVV
jgi:hypothetical protein